MTRAYRFCLLLYPRRHRDQFADEMCQVFEEALAESRSEGWAFRLRFVCAEMAGLIGGAAGAWIQKSSATPIPAASPAQNGMPQELLDAQRSVDAHVAAMVQAIANHQFERARLLSDQERIARQNLSVLREKYRGEYGMSF
jgi:hypothetical protein